MMMSHIRFTLSTLRCVPRACQHALKQLKACFTIMRFTPAQTDGSDPFRVQLPRIGPPEPGKEWVGGEDDDVSDNEIGVPRITMPAFYQPGKWGVAKDMDIMGIACPANKVAMMVNSALQDNGEMALVVGECLGGLGQAEEEMCMPSMGPTQLGKPMQ